MIKIRINGITWKIIGTSAGDEAFDANEGEEVMGITWFTKGEIYLVVDNISSELLYRTIKHELTHAFLFSYGINKEELTEEEVCNFVEVYAEDIIKKANSIFNRLTKNSIIVQPRKNRAGRQALKAEKKIRPGKGTRTRDTSWAAVTSPQ